MVVGGKVHLVNQGTWFLVKRPPERSCEEVFLLWLLVSVSKGSFFFLNIGECIYIYVRIVLGVHSEIQGRLKCKPWVTSLCSVSLSWLGFEFLAMLGAPSLRL